MKFTKNKGFFLIGTIIVLAIYHVIIFVLPLERHKGYWVGYVFTVIAILLTSGVILFSLGREGIKSKFYGTPLVVIAHIYFTIQIICGFAEMILPENFYKYEILVNFIILGLCLVGLISTEAGKGEVLRVEEKINKKVFYIKSLEYDVGNLLVKITDESTKKMVKELAETIKYSDPMSSPQLASIENRIENKFFELSENVDDINAVKLFCGELQQLFVERNQKCKLLK